MGEATNGEGGGHEEGKAEGEKPRRAPVRRPLYLMLPATMKTVVDGPDGAHEEPATWFISKHDTKDSIRKELERRGIDIKQPEVLQHMKIVRVDEVEFKASTQVLLEF